MHRALVRDADAVDSKWRVRECRTACGLYRKGRNPAGTGDLVSDVCRHIQSQPDQRLIQILDFGIEVEFRRARLREVAVGCKGAFKRCLGILAALRRSPLVGVDLNLARSHETGRKVDL